MAIAGARGPLRAMMEKTGLIARIGAERFFPTMNSAVEKLRNEYQ